MKKQWLQPWLLAVAVAGGLSGCSLFDTEEDVVEPAELPAINSQVSPKTVWSTSVGDGVENYYSALKPAYGIGVVVVASRDGEVVAMDAQSGEVQWRLAVEDLAGYDTEDPKLSGGPSIGFDQVYVGTEHGELLALSLSTGALQWVVKAQGEILAAPTVTSSGVVVHTSRGVLQSFSAYDGAQQWVLSSEQPPLTLRGVSQPYEYQGLLLYGRADGRLATAIADNGQPLWLKRLASARGATEIDRMIDADAQPLVQDDVAYAVAYNGELLAVDLRTANVLWQRAYSSAQDMALSGYTLVLTDSNGHVFAIDSRDGQELWAQRALSHRGVTSPAIVGGYVLVGDAEGYLHWLDRDTGEFVGQSKIGGDGLYVAPVVTDSQVVIQTRNGKVVALQLP